MLLLLRPRQTWMPYALPRDRAAQDAHNRQLQEAYASTRRVAAPGPEVSPQPPRDRFDDLAALGRLHQSGVLTDDEFAVEKARILEPDREPQ